MRQGGADSTRSLRFEHWSPSGTYLPPAFPPSSSWACVSHPDGLNVLLLLGRKRPGHLCLRGATKRSPETDAKMKMINRTEQNVLEGSGPSWCRTRARLWGRSPPTGPQLLATSGSLCPARRLHAQPLPLAHLLLRVTCLYTRHKKMRGGSLLFNFRTDINILFLNP